MLRIKSLINQYRKKGTGVATFTYALTGTPEEIADYRDLQGENYREEEGQPLFFSLNRVANNLPVVKRRDGSGYFIQTELQESRVEDKMYTIKALQAALGLTNMQIAQLALGAAPTASTPATVVVKPPVVEEQPIVEEPPIENVVIPPVVETEVIVP